MKPFCLNPVKPAISQLVLASSLASGLLLPQLASAATAPQSLALQLRGEAPFYQLNLPLEVISNASRDDLADLNIVNAKGEKVVWSWLQTETRREDLLQKEVPIFAVQGGGTKSEIGIALDKQGRLQVKNQRLSDKNPAYWLADLSQVKAQLLEANLTLASEAQGVFPLKLEISDDLQHWVALGENQTILQLSHAAQNLSQLTLNLQGQRGRYLRLTNLSDKAFKLEKLQIVASQHQFSLPRFLWTPEIKAESCSERYCDYLVPPHFSAEKIEIKLSQTNSLARLEIVGVLKQNYQAPTRRHINPISWLHQHRVQAKADMALRDQFYLLHQILAYKLNLAGTVLTTPVLNLDGANYHRLRLQIADGQANRQTLLGSEAPTIKLAMSEQSLVFLARGDAPFHLQVGGQQVNPSYSDSELLAPVRAQTNKKGNLGLAEVDASRLQLYPATTAGVNLSKPVKETVPENRKLWLWGVLIAALVLVGGMVWSLLAKAGDKKADASANS